MSKLATVLRGALVYPLVLIRRLFLWFVIPEKLSPTKHRVFVRLRVVQPQCISCRHFDGVQPPGREDSPTAGYAFDAAAAILSPREMGGFGPDKRGPGWQSWEGYGPCSLHEARVFRGYSCEDWS